LRDEKVTFKKTHRQTLKILKIFERLTKI